MSMKTYLLPAPRVARLAFAMGAAALVTAGCATRSAGPQDPNAGVYNDYYNDGGGSNAGGGSGATNGGSAAQDGDKPQPRMVTTSGGRKPRTGKSKALLAKRPPVTDGKKSKPKPNGGSSKPLPTPDNIVLTGFFPTVAPAGSLVTIFGEGLDQPGTAVQIGKKSQKIVEQAPDRLVFEASGGSGPVEVRARILRKMKTDKSETTFETLPRRGPFTTPRTNADQGLVGNVYKLSGDVQELPAFDTLGEPVAVIAVPNLDIPSTKTTGKFAGLDAYAIHFRGSLNVTEAADYTLCLNAGDGAQLYLDETLVVDNDGRHDTKEVCEPIAIEAGEYKLDLLYFQGEPGEMGLQLLWAKGDGEKKPIPTTVLFPPEDLSDIAKK